ncbi:MAG: GntR family transcriptional regulator [Desulfobacter sp.]
MTATKKQAKNQKIYQWLINQIRDKKICIGDQLPTEKNIMEMFGVNRTTVRTAFAKLEKADMIMRRSGKGTFLISDKPRQFVRTFNRIEIASLDAVDGKAVYRTIEKEKLVPPDQIRLLLNCKGDEILSFTRVISVDDEPSLLEKTYLCEKLSDLFTDLDTNQPYYPLIEKYGNEKLSHVKISFFAKKPDPYEQKLLRIDAHHPCISMQSQLFNDKYEPLEVLEAVYRGDKYSFSVESLGFKLDHD